MEYDIVVIGGGTSGYIAGSVLGRKGKKVLVVEKEKFGGVCVNFGCVPSIFLFDVSFLLSRGKEIGYYIGLTNNVEFSSNLFEKRDEIVEYLSEAGRKLIEKSGGESSIGEARIISKNEIEIERKNIKFKKLIIASGSKPKKPRIEGIDNAISEDEAVRLKSKPSSMVIIGGGYAGTEIAQIFSRLGSNVTLLARKCFLSTLPEDARNIVRQSLEFDGVSITENVKINRIYGEKVYTDKGVFEGEIVVYATGREPNFPKGIENLDLKINENGIVVDENMKANENVYAIGDVVDKCNKTAHSAMFNAFIAALHILKDTDILRFVRKSDFKIPQVLYTDPQVGIVGDLREAKKFASFPFTASTRAIISGLREGYVKIGINENNEIVFGEVVGNKAEELINTLTIIVNSKMRIESLALIPFVHPSFSEAITNAAKNFFGIDVDNYKDDNESH